MAYIKHKWTLETFLQGDYAFIGALNHMEDGITDASGGGGEPAQYLKDAVVASEKLTLTKKDGTTVELDVSAKANQTDLDLEKDARVNEDLRLNERIDNLESRGRFLSVWDCTIGMPETEPIEVPYTYKAGDYYIVGAVATEGESNLRPNGTQYTGEASTVVQIGDVAVNDFYTFDGSDWILSQNTQKVVTFNNIAGNARDNSSLNTEFTAIESSIAAKADKTYVDSQVATESTRAQLEENKKLETYDITVKGDHVGVANVPVFFDTEATADKIAVNAYSIALNTTKEQTAQKYSMDVPAATTITAGLMSAADKVALNNKAELPDKLPEELKVPGVDYPWFMINMDPKGIDAAGQLHLDHSGYNFNTKQYYTWKDKVIPMAATRTTGGLMTAADKIALDNKQDKLTAGDNITIAEDGKTISAKDTTYSAGTNITIDENNVISASGIPSAAEYVELSFYDDGDTGTLTDAQAQILLKSELNYIWLNGMHRLDFRYRDDNNNKATYSAVDTSSDGNKTHSIEINLTTKAFKVYHRTLQEKLTAGTNITISGNTISATGGGSEPTAYVKDATVSTDGHTLTLTKKDDSTVTFAPGAYSPFPAEFITDSEHSTKDFAESVLKHSTFKAGMAWHGELKCGDLPCGMVNVECTVIALVQDATNWKNNIAVIQLSSSNCPPYKWEYNTNSFNQSAHAGWKLIPCIQEEDCPTWRETGVNYDFIVRRRSSGVETKTIKSLTAGTNVTIDADRKINVDLSGKVDKPTEPVAGQGLNVPYYFDVNYSADKATVRDYTVDLLDKSKAPQQFSVDITSATQTAAGLMSAADKKAVDEMLPAYPSDTSAEYVLGLKYEDGAWKKYWKETINRSDVVNSGMVDYMVLKQ